MNPSITLQVTNRERAAIRSWVNCELLGGLISPAERDTITALLARMLAKIPARKSPAPAPAPAPGPAKIPRLNPALYRAACAVVEKHTGVPTEVMVSPRRTDAVALARDLCWWIILDVHPAECRDSLAAFFNRKKLSLWFGLKSIQNRINTEPAVAQLAAACANDLACTRGLSPSPQPPISNLKS